MLTIDSSNYFLSEVAQCADLCMKPWKHSVLLSTGSKEADLSQGNFSELILLIESRDANGERYKEKDLDLEIFRSGSELNITLSWHCFPLKPILWQGKHSLWMDANTGKRSSIPKDGEQLEALARRIRSRFSSLISS